MTATCNGDGLVRSHEEAAAVLRFSVPGARVAIERVRPGDGAEAARRYVVTLERVGHRPLSLGDVYALPTEAENLADRARTLADKAVRTAEGQTR